MSIVLQSDVPAQPPDLRTTLRILHIGKFFPPCPGGMETFLCDLLAAQNAQGAVAAAIVHHHDRGSPSGLETVAGASLWRVRRRGRLLHAPISPGFGRWLRRAIQSFQPDVLHFHTPNPSAFFALASPTARAIPWVITWQSDVIARASRSMALAYKVYRPLEQKLLARSRAVLVSSPGYLDASGPLRPWQSKCHVVPLGISLERLPAPDAAARRQAENIWADRGLRVLCLGRLTYYKGHEVLLRAISQTPGVQARLVGSGDLEAPLRASIAHLQLGDRVQMLGYVDDRNTQALLATCDCLVLPSIERTEAFGLALLEAMRYGKPVIATDIPGSGPGWIARQGPSGLVVPPGDAAALSTALARLRDQPQLRRELGESAAQVFADKFQIERVAREIDGVYRQIVGLQAFGRARHSPVHHRADGGVRA